MDFEEKITPGITYVYRATFLIAGIIFGYILIRLIITPYRISDNSMLPGLKKGELIFILKIGKPEIGDIVLSKSPVEPEKVLLKRIIAKEGDTLEIRNKILYRNDKKMKFSWKTLSADKRIFPMKFTGRDNLAIIRIKRKQYFLVGDNLDYSFDSRTFGPIHEEDIIGKLFFKI
jgi:signal peptidase I